MIAAYAAAFLTRLDWPLQHLGTADSSRYNKVTHLHNIELVSPTQSSFRRMATVGIKPDFSLSLSARQATIRSAG
jgi:hypothetical protein